MKSRNGNFFKFNCSSPFAPQRHWHMDGDRSAACVFVTHRA